MSENPLHKTRGPKQPGSILKDNRGRGEINVSKDYSFTNSRLRVAYIGFCLLLYAGFCVFLYLEGLAGLAIIMLILALLMFLLIWALRKYAS